MTGWRVAFASEWIPDGRGAEEDLPSQPITFIHIRLEKGRGRGIRQRSPVWALAGQNVNTARSISVRFRTVRPTARPEIQFSFSKTTRRGPPTLCGPVTGGSLVKFYLSSPPQPRRTYRRAGDRERVDHRRSPDELGQEAWHPP